MKVIGLMSGTSADGVDAALVEIHEVPSGISGEAFSDVSGEKSEGRIKIKLLAFEVYPYPSSLQKQCIDLASGEAQSVASLCHLNVVVGERFAEAALQLADKAGRSLSEIDLIGSHGQTIQHLPSPRRMDQKMIRSTLQIGESSVIAERTGITTIADFRTRDMAAGGEGAPLTPYLHYHLFSDPKLSTVMINIGGISNITYLKAGAPLEKTLAFDTGPGNMLMDGLVQHLTKSIKRFDFGGEVAKRGTIHRGLLSEWMQHPYLKKKPPKSTGREIFGQAEVTAMLKRGKDLNLSHDDLLATATAFTAHSIAQNIESFILKKGNRIDRVFVGGGGICNPVLMDMLGKAVAPVSLSSCEAFGQNSRAIEAMTFAVLAYQSWHNRPGNIPSVTGARHSVVLGKVVPR